MDCCGGHDAWRDAHVDVFYARVSVGANHQADSSKRLITWRGSGVATPVEFVIRLAVIFIEARNFDGASAFSLRFLQRAKRQIGSGNFAGAKVESVVLSAGADIYRTNFNFLELAELRWAFWLMCRWSCTVLRGDVAHGVAGVLR